MVKKINIEIIFNKRVLYTLILIGILAIVCVGVYAWTNPTTGVGHSHDEIEPCAEGEILQIVNGKWNCIQFIDNKCDTSGTCSQLCIGNNCKSKWTIDECHGFIDFGTIKNRDLFNHLKICIPNVGDEIVISGTYNKYVLNHAKRTSSTTILLEGATTSLNQNEGIDLHIPKGDSSSLNRITLAW